MRWIPAKELNILRNIYQLGNATSADMEAMKELISTYLPRGEYCTQTYICPIYVQLMQKMRVQLRHTLTLRYKSSIFLTLYGIGKIFTFLPHIGYIRNPKNASENYFERVKAENPIKG